MDRNIMVVIEGIDGTGKTTVAKGLAKAMEGLYIKTPPSNLSGLRKYFDGQDINAKYLFYLAALISSSSEIWRMLKNSSVAIDRYIATTICYHQAGGAAIDLVNWQSLPILKPDYQFCLEVSDREKWLKRISTRDGKDAAKKIENDYTRFMDIAKRMNKFVESAGGMIIDTNGLSKKQVIEKILNNIKGRG